MSSNKSVVIFLLKFFGTYIVLFLMYSAYLNSTQKKADFFECAPITTAVANQTNYLLNSFGFNSKIEQSTKELSLNLSINNKPIALIVEGCNSISIIILFISFIVAFSGNFIATVVYILFGSLLIYIINLFRIVIIAIALYKYPQHQELLHNIIFPTILYGFTFLLWFIWIRKFVKK